jgi:hypothetical protein
MKGRRVEDEKLRLVQVFLSQNKTPGPGVYEVSVDDDTKLYCNCPGFSSRGICKHTRFVKSRIENNNGTYPLEISSKATQDDADNARHSNQAFREFVIKFGRIEVY